MAMIKNVKTKTMNKLKRLNVFLSNVMNFFHVHRWEYEQDINQTVRRCKCGTAHVNKHMVSQIYGGEHWYDHNDS